MSSQKEKSQEFLEIAAKVRKIMAGIAEEMAKLSPNERAIVKREMKCLSRNSPAAAERMAILQLLGANESLPGTVLNMVCGERVAKRVRELGSIGVDIRRWVETDADGFSYTVYGWTGFREWQEHKWLKKTEDELPSLKRVM